MTGGSDTGGSDTGESTTGRTLLRSSAVVAAGTGLSRVTGLARTMAIAYALGTMALGDAYNLANTTPNLIYDLVLGGILSATLIPVVVERFEADDRKSIDALATVITILLIALTVLATIASPFIIKAYSLSLHANDPELAHRQVSLAVPLLLMFMPQVLFYGLSTLWTALLNARRSFAVPAFAPVLNNVIVISIFLALPHLVTGELSLERVRDDKMLLGLTGIGTTAGIVVMALVLWPAMRAAGIRLSWNPDWHDGAVRAVARLSGWTFGYVIANQAGFLVMLALINGTGQGAASAFTYAWQFFQLPYGLFTVSIMTTFTPELASHATRKDLSAFRERFVQGVRLTLLVMLPAAITYMTVGSPVVSILLERGHFGTASTEVTSSVMAWLAVGLPGFAVSMFMMRGFYAFKDTRTPFWLNLAETVAQIVLSLILVGPFGLTGVIAAFSICYTLMGVVGVLVLTRHAGQIRDATFVTDLLKLSIAGVVMAAAMIGSDKLISEMIDSATMYRSIARVFVTIAFGALAYVMTLEISRSEDFALINQLRRRRSRTRITGIK